MNKNNCINLVNTAEIGRFINKKTIRIICDRRYPSHLKLKKPLFWTLNEPFKNIKSILSTIHGIKELIE